ncbi:hypothetical protein GLOTRDRAFT_134470 [Gloeophyllum trabeum ATCC 11539]|uniref:Uncharacterized protein n=1 Tax=Gloeophyllum trabeum (strain ATCC 11539 / FP-39264 / Madison 617) TaxID=670483 RepID=S7PR15_GLOTA|nr:uncharacterized protein GLOTRDRAFT_134470 [Gloeophyllum trabeum ATCC 11539]EPQ49913.1 hypothetical protein GLOTRDRAFT_134470 [Gloeophyllum trabeum ATCC 11539]
MARDPQCVRVAGKGTSGSGYGTRFAVPEDRLSKTRIVHRALKIETWVAAYPSTRLGRVFLMHSEYNNAHENGHDDQEPHEAASDVDDQPDRGHDNADEDADMEDGPEVDWEDPKTM